MESKEKAGRVAKGTLFFKNALTDNLFVVTFKRFLKIIIYDLLDVFKSFIKLYCVDNDFK